MISHISTKIGANFILFLENKFRMRVFQRKSVLCQCGSVFSSHECCGTFYGECVPVKISVLNPALPLTRDMILGKLHLCPVPCISSTEGIQWCLIAFPALILYVRLNL